MSLPKGWAVIDYKQSFSQEATSNKKVKTKDCNAEGKFPVVDQGQEYICGYVDDQDKVIEVETPLVIFGDHTRLIKWINFNFVPGADGTKVLKPEKIYDARFFYYHMRNIELPDKGYSRHFKFLKEVDFLLPPLNEQKRIAKKLDELLATVESIKTRLDNAPTTIKRFRQSILSAATSGKLTEEWREENRVSDEWAETYLGNVIFDRPRNGYSPKGVSYETDIKNLTLSATTSSVFKADCYKYVDIEVKDDSHLWVNNGDILIQRANTLEYVGVSAIYNGVSKQYIYPDLMMKVIANNNFILTKFLHYSLLSMNTRQYFKNNATGTSGNMPKINQKVVMKAPLFLPLLEEQKEIVSQVESLFTLADTLEEKIEAAKKRVDKLTQSILAKAFRGELVPQDPNDESAEVLLERIKGEG